MNCLPHAETGNNCSLVESVTLLGPIVTRELLAYTATGTDASTSVPDKSVVVDVKLAISMLSRVKLSV